MYPVFLAAPGQKLVEARRRDFRAYTLEKYFGLLFNGLPMNVAPQTGIAPWMQDTQRQGFTLLAAARTTEASECCRRLLGAKPDLVEAHFLVGLIALELRQNRTAVNRLLLSIAILETLLDDLPQRITTDLN